MDTAIVLRSPDTQTTAQSFSKLHRESRVIPNGKYVVDGAN